MASKKYELVMEHTAIYSKQRIYRIRSLKDFICNGILIRKGDIGGFVQSENNLSHEGNCWLFDNSIAMNDSRVKDNASLHNDASVFDKTIVADNAALYNFSSLFLKAMAMGNSTLSGNAKMFAQSVIIDNASIGGESMINGTACISGNAKIYGNSRIRYNADISGDSRIFANMVIGKDAKITSSRDIVTASLDGYDCIFYRNSFDGISVCYGQFNDSIELFEEKIDMIKYGDLIRIIKQNLIF